MSGQGIAAARPERAAEPRPPAPPAPLEANGPTLGAMPLGPGACGFRVWAPFARRVELHLLEPEERRVLLEPDERGYHAAVVEGVGPGTLYLYRLDDRLERPDPASRSQPRGVHGPSAVVDPAFAWGDADWRGLPLDRYVLYEIHVGAFTPEGTFRAAAARLDRLAELGITAIELMPVAQFPGGRNWGYDGAYPFAVQDTYGGPDALKALVDACHRRGLAVVLDVVYNHLGPEGSRLADFGPYFAEAYRTPWGRALNFDGAGSDEVRRYFLDNALRWIGEFHVDALRLDAVHAIFDRSAFPFLEELGAAVHAEAERLGRPAYVIPESDLNDPRLLRGREAGGFGLDAQWSDDFHHALHALLTGEERGYYRDYRGVSDLETAFREGFVLSGRRSEYRGRRHGRPAADLRPERFVVYAQNHDQVGNRAGGERLSTLVPPDRLRLAAAATLLSPFTPLLFMGEEYGETAPFPYFVSHSHAGVAEAVVEGRLRELRAFAWEGAIPDPRAEETFRSAVLRPETRRGEAGAGHLRLHRELLRAREELRRRGDLAGEREVWRAGGGAVLVLRRRAAGTGEAPEGRPAGAEAAEAPAESLLILNLQGKEAEAALPAEPGRWLRRLDTAERRFGGPGTGVSEASRSEGELALRLSPWTAILLLREEGPGVP